MSTPVDTAAAVLVGGRSRRLGQNKALVVIGLEPLAVRVARRLAEIVPGPFLVAADPDPYAHLGFPVVTDRLPGLGALGGLHAALAAAGAARCLVVACDMPFVPPALLRRLVRPGPADVVVPRSALCLQPLCALYSRRCLEPIERAAAAGGRRIIDFFSEVTVEEIEVVPGGEWDPDGTAFLNINTPADLARARRLAGEE